MLVELVDDLLHLCGIVARSLRIVSSKASSVFIGDIHQMHPVGLVQMDGGMAGIDFDSLVKDYTGLIRLLKVAGERVTRF